MILKKMITLSAVFNIDDAMKKEFDQKGEVNM